MFDLLVFKDGSTLKTEDYDRLPFSDYFRDNDGLLCVIVFNYDRIERVEYSHSGYKPLMVLS